jgi:hypothetical protein
MSTLAWQQVGWRQLGFEAVGWWDSNETKTGSSLPALLAGEYFLIDDDGAYLTDENGAYLIGKDV